MGRPKSTSVKSLLSALHENSACMPTGSHRLSILTPREIDELYGLPRFTDEDRQLYFDLSKTERKAVDRHTASVRAHFILQLGYFKAKHQFFICEGESVLDDLKYILAHFFPGRSLASITPPSRPTRLVQERVILKLFDYRICDRPIKEELERKARRIAKLSTQPINILREVLRHLDQQRIVSPSYTFLQDMIGRVVTGESNRITRLLNQMLTPTIGAQLDALLQTGEQMIRLTELKREPKDFSYQQLRREVDRRKYFQPLHEFAQSFLGSADLSNENVKYYASLVQFYTVYKLQRMAAGIAQLYLLCFAYHRFRQINDNLIEAFIHLIDHYETKAKVAAEAAALRAMNETNEHLKAAGHVLDLFVDTSIPSDALFATVKEKAFSMLDPTLFPLVSDYLHKKELDKAGFEWDHYATISLTFKRNLRHLFTDLEFAGRVEDTPLLEAVVFLQHVMRQGKSPRQTNPSMFPCALIPKRLHRYLFSMTEGKGKCLEVDRYEFMVYRLLRNALEAGDIYVKDSSEFRRFEDDLINDDRWKEKDAILREIGAPILLAPIEETLAALRDKLEAKFEAVNQRIADGRNKHIKIRGANEKRRWTLVYPREEEPVNNPFYSQLPGLDIASLLWFVAEQTGFLSAFTHVLNRFVKDKPDPREIFAAVVAMGTNMGMWKMAEVSGLSYSAILTTARNHLRLETLHAANDAISNASASLPVFHLYDIQNVMHSSSDGQRFETQIDTINARYSPKYFGLKKGISACTLVANHVPINAKIIGADEHESHYVFDLLFNNTTDVQSGLHSTDTHGTNQVNFFTLLVFGYCFAPRYRDLHKKMDTLVSFKHPKHYTDCLIKPTRKVFDDLIVKEWPNILRIMASLAQKEATQAIIVRKLSSYARQNQTKKALWELENICRTIYILEFIDDVSLRQSVQKALNRGEAYHRFRRAIAYINSGKYRVRTEGEQQIWNECSRLIANAVIYYNMVLLSRVYEQKIDADDLAAVEVIPHISPVAWQHVNLFGKFEFSPAKSKVDIDALVARFADPSCWSKALVDENNETGLC